jgi:hypothetical protein
MTTHASVTELYDLQEKVVDTLVKSSQLMEKASGTFQKGKLTQRYNKAKQKIEVAIDKVIDLELRMSIVAPMKAGKSTIINALIGLDVTPSRSSAMTTFPTEVVLKQQLDEPQLIISEKTVTVFGDTLKKLRKTFKSLGETKINQELSEYPHLLNLSTEINRSYTIEFSSCIKKDNSITIKGSCNIITTLTKLSDIIRITNIIKPNLDPLNEIVELPRIEVNLFNPDNQAISKYLGNLVLVDTPGPNEAGDHLRLATVVKKELDKSSIVLIVLDYTGLKSKAAEQVKEDVQKVIDIIGKDSLFVLVNKIDQRKSSDPGAMNSEEVHQFVCAQFGLENAQGSKQVFEISARRAVCAAKFLKERQEKPGSKNVKDFSSASALAEEVYGIDWEDDFEEATLDELQKKAERLWKKSNFSLFLENAVKATLEQVAPQCMLEALQVSLNCLNELNDNINFFLSGLETDEQKIEKEISDLIDKEEFIKTKLDVWNDEIKGILDGNKKELEDILNEVRLETELNIFAEQLKIKLEFRGIKLNSVKFETEIEAKKMAAKIASGIRDYVEEKISRKVDQIQSLIEHTQDRLSVKTKELTNPIVNEVKSRIKEKFDVDLTWSSPDFKSTKVAISEITAMAEINPKMSLLGILHNACVTPLTLINIELPVVRDAYYVDIKTYVKNAADLIHSKISELAKIFEDYVSNIFASQIENNIKSVEDFISNQQEVLQQSIQKKYLSAEKYNKLTKDMDDLRIEIFQLVETEIKPLMQQINKLKQSR